MAQLDPQILAHLEWLGFVQPTGLVVSAPALVRAGVLLDRRDAEGQRLLREAAGAGDDVADTDIEPAIENFERFARDVLSWSFNPAYYVGAGDTPIPPELEVSLPDYGVTLSPDFAVRERDPSQGSSPWQLLVTVIETGQTFDKVVSAGGHLEASPHGQMERLLRETGAPAGLLCNGAALRLISAPRGESSGWLDFPVEAMVQNAGRPICTALRLLLREPRLLTVPRSERFTTLLTDSRRFQNEVSEKLAEQVLHALYELLRGFQAANDASKGDLLRAPLSNHPDDVYRGLLTVIMRLVFLLYAEERDMLPTHDETFERSYSIAGLHQRLRESAGLYPDTMDLRFGAWAQLVGLFRMVHDGVDAGAVHLPARHGGLFDPDRFPFLEGRGSSGARQKGERLEIPLVTDGTVYRALDKLLVLDGERLSYRALDVEQIGSVYQTMMGFRLETATGRSVAIKPAGRGGAPATMSLDALLGEEADKRAKWIKDHTDRKLTPKVTAAVKEAASLDELHGALLPVIDTAATPDVVAPGAMILQPSEERRRSGSHYTPRELTEPIVRATLAPILKRLGGDPDAIPTPEEILALKVCDPAMGSGAFLVEACRQLADELIDAWNAHGDRPEVPPDEDEVIFARRLVAQRCLYGVDRNPMAVDLAKMSLWLATLAREHALTFLDHAFRHGDALVGLTRRQIEAFHWDTKAKGFESVQIEGHMERVRELRAEIRAAGEDVSDFALRDMWDEARSELDQMRLIADLAVVAFFSGANKGQRETRRTEYASAISGGEAHRYQADVMAARDGDPALAPFHWEVEFPEVFERDTPGFDAFVGNPPFAGKNTLASANPSHYLDWLKQLHTGTHGNADLVAHFFRRSFDLLREGGTLGLIATNTIAQGDTRSTGLRWICTHGGDIYTARRRVRWPGLAAVVVSVVHVAKGDVGGPRVLDGRSVETITAFLFHRGAHDDPVRLAANAGKSFQGSIVLGMGFTFDDTDAKGVATPLAEMRRLIEKRPENADVIFPYIGGEEVNTSPTHAHHRYVINFGERTEEECRKRWPELMAIVEDKVKPERLKQGDKGAKEKWWQYIRPRPELHAAIAGLDRVLAISQTSARPAFTFLPTGIVFSHKVVVFPLESHAAFVVLQASSHDAWLRFFGSTMKDDPVYTPSDCFDTFPFPRDWQSNEILTQVGMEYYECRASLMLQNDEGLTKTYNRFHDENDQTEGIVRLRELHAEMDRAVLDAYGWSDISVDCEYLPEHEDEPDGKTRYRWPNEVHDEVLARLLELNATRAAEEARAGGAIPCQAGGGASKPARSAQTEALF